MTETKKTEKQKIREAELVVIFDELTLLLRQGKTMISPEVMAVLKKLTIKELLMLNEVVQKAELSPKEAVDYIRDITINSELRAKIKDFNFSDWLTD